MAASGLLVLIQLVPISRTNPPVVKELNWDSPKTRAYAKRACFDCHSHETRWPWYAYVAPVSWLIAKDVNTGRERMNFSSITEDDRAEILIERIEKREMPLPEYLALHPEARLSEAERQEYISGLRSSFALSGLVDKDESKTIEPKR